jgi:hypothetical protein
LETRRGREQRAQALVRLGRLRVGRATANDNDTAPAHLLRGNLGEQPSVRIDNNAARLGRGPESELSGQVVQVNTMDRQSLGGLKSNLKREVVEYTRLSQ